MSRTYRDTLNAKRKRRMVPSDWHWLTTCPWRWRHAMMILPARRAQQAKLAAVLAGIEDDGDFPDYRKPHVYYW